MMKLESLVLILASASAAVEGGIGPVVFGPYWVAGPPVAVSASF